MLTLSTVDFSRILLIQSQTCIPGDQGEYLDDLTKADPNQESRIAPVALIADDEEIGFRIFERVSAHAGLG